MPVDVVEYRHTLTQSLLAFWCETQLKMICALMTQGRGLSLLVTMIWLPVNPRSNKNDSPQQLPLSYESLDFPSSDWCRKSSYAGYAPPATSLAPPRPLSTSAQAYLRRVLDNDEACAANSTT
jgi:hypothetical protein